MAFKEWHDYGRFAHLVSYGRRFIREPEVEAFLEAVRETAKARVLTMPAGYNKIWRARMGPSEHDVEIEGELFPRTAARLPEDMKPKERGAIEGRVNPKGIPCFYGATTPDTAMAEVRPGMGELVSVARYKLLSEIKLVDCSKYHDRDKLQFLLKKAWDEAPAFTPKEIEDSVWIHIDHAFSEPVARTDDTPDYVPTQILAELFKAEGYGGIVYKSKFTDDGFNLAFFDPGVLTQLQAELRETEKVRVTFSNPHDEYFVQADGSLVRQIITAIEPLNRDEAAKPTKSDEPQAGKEEK